MKVVVWVKSYLRKRRVCAQRGRERRMLPLRINKKRLVQTRQAYVDRVDALAEQIKAFVPPATETPAKEPLVGYRILSYNGDQLGKVLEKDGRIFRGIYAESAEWFQALWNKGLIQVLAQAGLVPETTITHYQAEGFPIILEHKTVEISTAKMWNPDMVRDACITLSFINEVCRRFGYKLIDGHLNNVTFVNGKPMFTDIGSIVEDRGQYTAYESGLIFAGGYKLLAASLGNSILDRLQFFDEDNNAIWSAPFCYDEATYECRCLLKTFRRWHFWHSSRTANRIIFRLFELGEVRPEYFDLLFPRYPVAEVPTQDYTALFDVMGRLSVQSVTVVGGPVELGQQIYDRFGYHTVVLDHSVDAARLSYRKANDISCYCYNYLYGGDVSTLKRIRSELVVAENVTENLISYQNWKLESLFHGLAKLTERYVVVSFYPGRAAARCMDEAKGDRQAFETKFSAFFDIVEAVDLGGSYVYVGRLREDGVC